MWSQLDLVPVKQSPVINNSFFLDNRHAAIGSGCNITAGIASVPVPLPEKIVLWCYGT